MSLNKKSPDHDIAYAAATEMVAAATSSLGVIGRYLWNLQMQLLVATGVMRLFRANWWLFLVVGFLLLAFVMPLGVAFVVSACCAGAMDPKADDNFVVPLKHDDAQKSGVVSVGRNDVEFSASDDCLENVRLAAATHHVGYLNTINRDLEDNEVAAAALGAFDGTMQALGVKLSDLDMQANGAAFILGQLTNLERVDKIGSNWIAEVTVEAMNSDALEAIRTEASRFAYAIEGAMRDGPVPPMR